MNNPHPLTEHMKTTEYLSEVVRNLREIKRKNIPLEEWEYRSSSTTRADLVSKAFAFFSAEAQSSEQRSRDTALRAIKRLSEMQDPRIGNVAQALLDNQHTSRDELIQLHQTSPLWAGLALETNRQLNDRVFRMISAHKSSITTHQYALDDYS